MTSPAEPSALQQISNEIGRLYKDQFGRGPTRVRSDWASDDVVVVIFENSLTSAEQTLAGMGEHERIRDHRMFLQYASVGHFCEPIERITGRRVRAFVSGIDTLEDVSMETYVLHGKDSENPSRIAAEPAG